jgi:hypothetical protein
MLSVFYFFHEDLLPKQGSWLAFSCSLKVLYYWYGTWSLTLREERRLRVFEDRVLRIFGLKRDEVMGGWRKLHSELHNLYSLPSIIRMIKSRRMRWAGNVSRMGEKWTAYRILVGRPRHRWVNNIKMDL